MVDQILLARIDPALYTPGIPGSAVFGYDIFDALDNYFALQPGAAPERIGPLGWFESILLPSEVPSAPVIA